MTPIIYLGKIVRKDATERQSLNLRKMAGEKITHPHFFISRLGRKPRSASQIFLEVIFFFRRDQMAWIGFFHGSRKNNSSTRRRKAHTVRKEVSPSGKASGRVRISRAERNYCSRIRRVGMRVLWRGRAIIFFKKCSKCGFTQPRGIVENFIMVIDVPSIFIKRKTAVGHRVAVGKFLGHVVYGRSMTTLLNYSFFFCTSHINLRIICVRCKYCMLYMG